VKKRGKGKYSRDEKLNEQDVPSLGSSGRIEGGESPFGSEIE